MPGCLVIGLTSSLFIPEVPLVAASVIKGGWDARLLFCWVRDRYLIMYLCYLGMDIRYGGSNVNYIECFTKVR